MYSEYSSKFLSDDSSSYLMLSPALVTGELGHKRPAHVHARLLQIPGRTQMPHPSTDLCYCYLETFVLHILVQRVRVTGLDGRKVEVYFETRM